MGPGIPFIDDRAKENAKRLPSSGLFGRTTQEFRTGLGRRSPLVFLFWVQKYVCSASITYSPKWGNRSVSSCCFRVHSFTSLWSRLMQDECGEKAVAFMRTRSVLGGSVTGALAGGRRGRGLLLDNCRACAIVCVVGATPCIGRLVFRGWGDLQTMPCGSPVGFNEADEGGRWECCCCRGCCCKGAGMGLKCSWRTFKISVSLWRCRFWANLLCNFFFTVAPFFRSSSSSLKAKGSSNSASR